MRKIINLPLGFSVDHPVAVVQTDHGTDYGVIELLRCSRFTVTRKEKEAVGFSLEDNYCVFVLNESSNAGESLRSTEPCDRCEHGLYMGAGFDRLDVFGTSSGGRLMISRELEGGEGCSSGRTSQENPGLKTFDRLIEKPKELKTVLAKAFERIGAGNEQELLDKTISLFDWR